MSASHCSLRCVDAAEVAAYKRAVNFNEETTAEDVPPLFVMRWLAGPATSAAIRSAVPPGHLPLQTRQHLRIFAPLEIGQNYELTISVTAHIGTEPLQVHLAFAVSSQTGAPILAGDIDFICIMGDRP